MLPKFEDFLRIDLIFVAGESQALMTPQQARTLSWKLIEMAEAAERSGEAHPCVLLSMCDSEPDRRHEEAGIYVAPAAEDSGNFASPQRHPKS